MLKMFCDRCGKEIPLTPDTKKLVNYARDKNAPVCLCEICAELWGKLKHDFLIARNESR